MKGGECMKYCPIDYYRSVKIEESSEDGLTFKVSVDIELDIELFNYKTKEEIVDMIERAITKHMKEVITCPNY